MKSQWKLRQQHDQNFPTKGKPLQNKYILSEDQKEQDYESNSQNMPQAVKSNFILYTDDSQMSKNIKKQPSKDFENICNWLAIF